MLCSFCFYIKINEKKSLLYYVLFILTYTLSIFSKENALVLPALLLLYHWLFAKKIQWYLFLPAPIIIVFYAILRISFGLFTSYNFDTTSSLSRIPGFFKAITTYLRLLVLPLGIHVDYGQPLSRWSDYTILIGIFITAFFMYIAFKYRKNNRLVCFSILWFFIGLMPVSNIAFKLPFFMTEHYLYLPSIGFFIIISYLLVTIYRSSQALSKLLTIVLITYYSFFTIQQHAYWKTPDKLYKRILQFNPSSEDAYINYGHYAIAQKDYKKSIALLKKAKKINPDISPADLNLAASYFFSNNYKASHEILERLLTNPSRRKENNAKVNLLIAMIYKEEGETEKSIYHLKKTIELNPYTCEAYLTLAALYKENQKYAIALNTINRAITLGLVITIEKKENALEIKCKEN